MARKQALLNKEQQPVSQKSLAIRNMKPEFATLTKSAQLNYAYFVGLPI